MGKVIDIKNMQTNKVKAISKKPDWTPEEIQPKIQPYIDYLNQANKVFCSKKGDRWTAEESEQIKRLVFRYTCECYSCTAMADEFKKYFPWRSTGSILSKISNIRQSCYQELEDFYFKVAYCAAAVRDAEMHYSSGKIEFGNYFQYRMLQEAGFISCPDDEKGIKIDSKIKEIIKEHDIVKQAALVIFDLNKKKRIKNITTKEVAELLFTTVEDVEDIVGKINMDKITTKNLLGIAEKMDNGIGKMVRGLIPIFVDKEKTEQWKRAEKFRNQRYTY